MPIIGYLKDGEYHTGKPDLSKMQKTQQATYKAWDHDKQRFDHKADILQPRLSNGQPNPEFIQVYPEESQAYGFIMPSDEIGYEV